MVGRFTYVVVVKYSLTTTKAFKEKSVPIKP